MSVTGLEVFDRTLHVTNLWLGEMGESLGPDRHVSWHALGAVLHTLRDRLPLPLAVHLGAQLPMLVRGLYFDQWHPRARPLKLRTAKQFLEEVATRLEGTRPINSTEACHAVFRVLSHHVDPDQIAKVRGALSEPVRRLWPESGPEKDKATAAMRSVS